jgi:opacity protein-like surface antigen
LKNEYIMVCLNRLFFGKFIFALWAAGFATAVSASDVSPDMQTVEIVDKIDHESCFYGSLGGGLSSYKKLDSATLPGGVSFEDSGFIDAGGGCQVMNWARIEGELGYRFDSTIKNKGNALPGKLKSFTGFGNVWLEPLDVGNGAKPYIGGGIGFASHKLKTSLLPGPPSNGWSTKFAWQAGAGIGVELIENITLDLGYRFKSLGEPRSRGFADLYAHEFRAGLRFRFGGL